MTGITKDELMQIMKEAMALEVHSPHVFSDGGLRRAAHFANAILERAAVEFEKPYVDYETNTDQAAQSVRALKINTGD